jgi:NAD(P)H-quinone oxidoreductase subunit J
MSDSAPTNPTPTNPAPEESASAVATLEPGPVSQWLSTQGFDHDVLDPDHVGVEQIGVESAVLPIIAAAIKSHGFDYLQCQGGYDEGPGERLVCFYHFIAMAEQIEAMTAGRPHQLREVRLKVFLSREGTPSLPSIYGLFRGADWQERETFDMYGIEFEGHPHPKRLLMPEDWKGWPLRKDYVQPDFYEMQDAF